MKKVKDHSNKTADKHLEHFLSRLKMINYLYKYQLLNQPLSSDEAFESGDFSQREIKMIEKIAENYPKLQASVKKYLHETWTWERLAPLEKAILMFGAFELQINDLALVINELIIITKGLIPGDKFQYINSILDLIGNEYEKIKNH